MLTSNEIIVSGDKEKIINYYKECGIDLPEDDEMFWLIIHKTICGLFLYSDTTITASQFNESFNWLEQHGYEPLDKEE